MKGICIENMYQKRNLEDQDLLDTTASSKKKCADSVCGSTRHDRKSAAGLKERSETCSK